MAEKTQSADEDEQDEDLASLLEEAPAWLVRTDEEPEVERRVRDPFDPSNYPGPSWPVILSDGDGFIARRGGSMSIEGRGSTQIRALDMLEKLEREVGKRKPAPRARDAKATKPKAPAAADPPAEEHLTLWPDEDHKPTRG